VASFLIITHPKCVAPSGWNHLPQPGLMTGCILIAILTESLKRVLP
jgi:hypothetical protein